MRKLSLLALLVLSAGLTAFSYVTTADSRTEEIRSWYLDRIADFTEEIRELQKRIASLRSEPGSKKHLEEARSRFEKTRSVYKRMEVLVGTLDRYHSGLINGPPLPHIDESSLMRTVVEPEGFQVIEEILFDPVLDSIGIDPDRATKLKGLADRLLFRAGTMATMAKSTPIEDRYLFQAMRSALMRIAFMGITGFDTPVRTTSIAESRVSLAGVAEVFTMYLSDLESRSPGLAAAIQKRFEEGEKYLEEHADFDSFDRFLFIREYIDPLYRDLLTAHRALGYPLHASVEYNRPVRYEGEGLFDPESWNAWAFSPDPNDRRQEHGVELGRTLFFDPVLSINLGKSCSSCHRPDLAFSDGLKRSSDITGHGVVGRNSPTLINAAFQRKFFWDGRTEELEQQVEDVLLNHSEMGMTFELLIERLKQSAEYRQMFESAFPGTTDASITKHGITRALAAYMRSLSAMNSRFDRLIRNEIASPDLNDQRIGHGFNLFMGKAACGTCHFAPFFSGLVPPDYLESETEVLGVPTSPDTVHPLLDDDLGRFRRYRDEIYQHSFKTVSVRNVELTSPYMHNGAFSTLEEVVDFYERGGGRGLGFNLSNQTLPGDRLNLTQREKEDLVLFMKGLTDTVGTTAQPAHLPMFESRPEWNSR